jgi:hypothetical protein
MFMRILGVDLNKKSFVRWKIYIDRARMYLGYFNFLMIAFVFLNSIKNQGIRGFLDENHLITYPLIIIAFLVFSFILGRLDTKLGLRREELRNLSVENPVLMDILKSLEEIKGKQESQSNKN